MAFWDPKCKRISTILTAGCQEAVAEPRGRRWIVDRIARVQGLDSGLRYGQPGRGSDQPCGHARPCDLKEVMERRHNDVSELRVV